MREELCQQIEALKDGFVETTRQILTIEWLTHVIELSIESSCSSLRLDFGALRQGVAGVREAVEHVVARSGRSRTSGICPYSPDKERCVVRLLGVNDSEKKLTRIENLVLSAHSD